MPIVGAKPFEKAGGIVYSQVPMVKKDLVFQAGHGPFLLVTHESGDGVLGRKVEKSRTLLHVVCITPIHRCSITPVAV